MRTKSKTVWLPDGSTVVESAPQEQAQREFEDGQVRSAIEHHQSNRDIEPLLELLLEANPGILRNPAALSLLARAARGEAVKGRGRVRTKEMIERERRMLAAAEWLKKIGIPLKNASSNGKPGKPEKQSACRLIAKRLHLSEDAVYSVVLKQKKELAKSGQVISRLRLSPYLYLGPRWVWCEQTPTAGEVLAHYFDPKPELYASAYTLQLCDRHPHIIAAAKRVLEQKYYARPGR